MSTPNPLRSTSLTCKLLVLLTLTLLLTNAYVVQAQDTTANTNVNASNTNANANANTSANGNQNANASGGATASPSPSPPPSQSPTPCSGEVCRQDELAKSYWFYLTVIALFAIVLVPFGVIIVRAIKFSRATYGPLGLPEGSLRAMLAYTLVAYIGFYVLASVLSFSEFKPPEFLIGIVATVIGFYFGSRSSEDKGGAPKPGVVQGNVTDSQGAVAAKATVDLFQSGVKKDTETTDDKGNYKFDQVPAGEYEIQASAQGSQPSDLTKVTLKAGAAQSVNLKLK